MKCFRKFLVFLFAVLFTAINSLYGLVYAVNTQYKLIGWQDLSGNDSVVSVSIEQADSTHKTMLSKYVEGTTPTTVVTAQPGEELSVRIRLKDGYQFLRNDDCVLYLAGVQSGTDNVKNSSSTLSIKMPGDWTEDTDFVLNFATKSELGVINNVDLDVASPKCGTVVDEMGTPPPTITCASSANYTVHSTDWIRHSTVPEEPFETAYDFTVVGGNKYGVLALVDAKTGYKFNDEPHNVYITLNDGKATYIAKSYKFFRTEIDEIEKNLLEIYGWVPAVHIPVETKQNIVEPTCTENGSYDSIINCQACHTTIDQQTKTTDATGHDWDEWVVTKEPTATEKGEKTRICKNDPSHVQTEEIPACGEDEPEDEPGDEPEVTYYRVNFDNKGLGIAPKTQIVKKGKKAIEPAPLYAMGFHFGGWYTDESYSQAFNFDTPITSDITLYAKWTPVSTGFIQTGDNSNLMFHSQMMLLSLAGLILICYPQSKCKISLRK